MKAAVRLKYGLPDVLHITEVAIPVPKHNEVLVKVYAATVSRTDCHVLSGLPFFMRLFTGLLKPRLTITGTDFAGQIEATGKNVTSFKTGDKVMGFEFFGLRSHANYLVLPETKDIITMPENQTYQQAAACIEGAFYAINGFKKMNPKAGQKALVNGATGAIGAGMVQFFKFAGLSVTAVCRNENSALVRSLGADKIIDYQTEDFTKDNEQYDFVFDAVGKSSFSKCKTLLSKNGIYGTSVAPNFLRLFLAAISGGKKEIFAPPKNFKACMAFIKTLIANGNFKPVIDREYPIDQVAAAFEYVATGQKIGNVIITMDN